MMARAAEATEAISPYIRSSGSAWLRSCRTSVSSTQAPRVPTIAPGPYVGSTASTATSATTAPAKARAMPWRAGHMPLRRNQPAAVRPCRAISGRSRAYCPRAAATASSSPRTAVSMADCGPGSMIGDRPSARAWAGSTARSVLPARVGGDQEVISCGSPGASAGSSPGVAAAWGGRYAVCSAAGTSATGGSPPATAGRYPRAVSSAGGGDCCWWGWCCCSCSGPG